MRARPLFLLSSLLAVALLLGARAAWAAGGAKPPTQVRPEPTLVLPDNTTVFVVFKFGAWVRIAYNRSQAVAPLAVYVYSRTGLPVELYDNYNHTAKIAWGLALNVTKLDVKKPYQLVVKYRGKSYVLNFRIVKAIKEEEKKEKTITLSLSEFREWLDREAQYATALAVAAFVLAVGIKRKTLLLSTFNALNLAVVFLGGFAIYLLAKTGHSRWLVAPFTLSYLLAYRIYPVGRKIRLIKIVPSMRKFIAETAILYRTTDGKLAYARQSIGEAVKRWLGKHILVKDAETGKIGEISEDKVWKWEEVDTLEKMDALLVLDAELTKERVVEEERGGGLYE